jgi:VCBS repeat-containing protein
MQSLHDNLLGNLTDYALHQRYDAAGLYSTMLMLVDNQDSTLPGRTVEPVTGNEGAANGSTVADGHAFDLTHGYATHASGQLAANDPDTGDNTNLSWSVANGAGTYGTFSVDTTGKWTYVLDDARTATQALGQGEHGTETFNVTVTDGHGGTTTQAVTITVDGTNDAPVITTAAGEASATLYASGALSNVVTADVAGDHAFHFEEPGSGPRMDPALETMIANLIATNTDPSNNTMNMQAVLAGVQAVLGHAAGEADAIAAVWTYIDDVYTSSAGYYKTALNAVGVRLGIAYAEYIDAGGEPLTNVIVKYHPDGADGNGTDGIPDRLQSMHDNLLGAVDTPSIDDKFSADPVLLTVLKAEIAAAGLTDRPIYSGDESGIQSNKAATVAWDQDNGLLPGGTHQVVTGQLTATDVDDNDVGKLTWSANHLNGTYGTFTLDSTTGQWTYTLDASLAATRALGANDVATDSFVATVADAHDGSANETVTVTVHGTDDAPTLDLDGSAAGTGYETSFTPGGNAVAIAAGDTTIADVDSTMMSRAVIVLTNAQSGDVLSVGQLSPNMSFTMDTSLAGQITVTINGAATLANYDAAIESVKFSTSSSSSLDRWLTVAVDDDQGATSNTATSIIHSAGSTIDVVDGPHGLQFAWNGNSGFDHPHNNGTVTGFDTVSDYASATKLVFPIAPTLAANVSASGADHASFLDYDNGTGNTIHAHSITNGVVTFYSDTAGTDPITLANDQNHNGLAAAVDYLMRNDLGAAGATVVFNVGSDSFVFEQGADTPYLASTSAPPDHSASGDSTDILVKLTGQSNPSTIAAEIGSGHKIDPIILDLDGNGVHLNGAASFDLANAGQPSTFAWPGTTDGILVADLDHSGTIQNGSEVFSPSFGGGDYATSLDALKTYDSNGDGKITADDAKFGDIGVWVDANGNGVSDAGEVHSLSDLGIAGIDLGANEVDFDIDGQHVFAQGTFELSTGETSDYVGVDLGAPLPDLTGDPTAADAGIGVPPEVTGAIHAGTAGVDNFALTDLHAVDFIADYNFGQGDTVDLSALLGHNSGATAANAADYVKVDGNTVAVDTSGSGHDFVDVAVLNHPVPDVKVILDDGVDVTISHIINQNG